MRRALLIAAVGVLGLGAGRLWAPGDPSPSPPHPGYPGPTRQGSGGVGVGYAHTRDGALAANAGYLQALADVGVLRRGELRRRVEALAVPSYVPAILAASEPGARRLMQGALGSGIEQEVPTAYFAVPISYRLLSYSPRRAVIQTWGFTVLGNATTAEPAAYFGTSRIVLAWAGGDWKIAASRAAFGPTPRLLTPREGGEGFGLVDLLERMERYGVAP
jgi:hypothetical protein